MKKSIPVIMLLMLLGSGIGAFAQAGIKYEVIGLVADSLTLVPEPYATIRIFRSGDDSTAVAMLVSDENGKFSVPLEKKGEYSILVTSLGRMPLNRAFNVVSQKTDLGTLLLAEDINMIGEVSVVAKKPLVKVDMDKIAYDVAEDPESESKTVLDMLRKVPMVTVDGEGNVSLVGKSSFKIYMNGKPSNMITNNPKEVLRSMPASSVKNIEVITNPGVKYDAEGVGGIINIVTTGAGTLEGYSLNFSGSYMTNNSYNASLYGTTKIGKFSVSGNYGFTDYKMSPMSTTSVFEYFNNPDIAKVDAVYDDVRYRTKMHNMSVDASYELDSLNLFSLSGTLFRIRPENSSSGYNNAYAKNGQLLYGYDIDIDGNSLWGSGNIALDYQHLSAKRAGEMFVFSYRMDRTPSLNEQTTTLSNAVGTLPSQQYVKSNGNSLENTFQADYTIPFRKIHSMNIGAKYIYRINDSKNIEQGRASLDDEWNDVDRVGSGNNRHRQHVFGAYAEYNLRYRKFGLKGGVRYEYTSQNVNYDNYSQPPVDVSFSDLVPSLLLSYSLKDAQTLSLGYNMRINRPGINLLNPFRDSSQSPFVLQYGNPDLDTERYHSLTFGYGLFTPNFSVNLNFDYSFTNNAITTVSFVDKDDKINYTHANIGRNSNPMLNLYVNWNPSGSTRLTFSGMYGHQFIETSDKYAGYGLEVRRNNGGQYNIYAGVQQNLPWKLNLSCYGGGGRGGIDLYTVKPIDYYYYGIQLQRSFLKDEKLSVSLNANNFAPKYFKYDMVSQADDYRHTMSQRNRQFNYSITVSYRIGNFSSSVKKAVKTITNNDVVGNSSKKEGVPSQGR